jgi:hypothetical protein
VASDRSVQRHGIAEIFVAIGDPAAVEADEFRFFGQSPDLIEPILAREYTEVAGMIPGADMLAHGILLSIRCLG